MKIKLTEDEVKFRNNRQDINKLEHIDLFLKRIFIFQFGWPVSVDSVGAQHFKSKAEKACDDLYYLQGCLVTIMGNYPDPDLYFECEMINVLVLRLIDDFKYFANNFEDEVYFGSHPWSDILSRSESQYIALFKSLRKIKKHRG